LRLITLIGRRKMKYTAKQWRLTIWFADVLLVGLLLFGTWLVWDFYRISGQVRFPFHYSHLLSLAVFFALRGIASREKKKAEQAEATSSKP
jgi:uncharacterized membrane protein YqjE